MIKLESFAKLSLVLVMVTVLLTFFTNVFLVPNVSSYVNASNQKLNQLNDILTSYENSLKILSIAHESDIDSELKNHEVALIQSNQQQFEVIITDFLDGIDELNQISLNRHARFLQATQTLAQDLFAFNQYLSIFLDESIDEVNQYTTMITILPLVRTALDELNQVETILTESMLADLSLLINVLFGLLSLLILLSLIFQFFLFKQIPRLTKRLRHLAYPLTNTEQISYHTNISELSNIYGYMDVLEKDRVYLKELRESMGQLYLIDDVMETLFTFVNKHIDVYRIGSAFIDYKKEIIIAEAGFIKKGTIKLNPGFTFDINSTSLKQVIETRKPLYNPDVLKSYQERPDSRSLKLITEEGIASNIIFPLKIGEFVFGLLFISSDKKSFFTQ